MSDSNLRGVEALYKVLDIIKSELETNTFVNDVTFGSLTEVDLRKQTIFPLANLTLNSVTHNDNNLSFNFTLVNVDIVNISKDDTTNIMGTYQNNTVASTRFYGNDNQIYILTNQLYVVNRLVARLKSSMIYLNGWEIEGDPVSNVIDKELENTLTGYQTDFTLSVANDINKC
jgi:hypothetical protein